MKAKTNYSTTICREEFIRDVSGSVGFASTEFRINAGDPNMFPWLSQIAASFEFYHFKKLQFQYRTSSGEVISGTNPAIGKVLLCSNYDANAPRFTSKIEMENYVGCASGPSYQKIITHYVNCSRTALSSIPIKNFYVAKTAPQADIHFHDLGKFFIATAGMPAPGNIIGELWVNYEVELIKPLHQPDIQVAQWTCNADSSCTGNTQPAATAFGIFGSIPTINHVTGGPAHNATMQPDAHLLENETPGPAVRESTSLYDKVTFESADFGVNRFKINNIRMAPGKYMVTIWCQADQPGNVQPTIGWNFTSTSNCSFEAAFDRDRYIYQQFSSGAATQSFASAAFSTIVNISEEGYASTVGVLDGPGGVLSFSGSLGAWIGQTNVFITQVSAAYKTLSQWTTAYTLDEATTAGLVPPNDGHIAAAAGGLAAAWHGDPDGSTANNWGTSGQLVNLNNHDASTIMSVSPTTRTITFLQTGEYTVSYRIDATPGTFTGYPTFSGTATILDQAVGVSGSFTKTPGRIQVQVTAPGQTITSTSQTITGSTTASTIIELFEAVETV